MRLRDEIANAPRGTQLRLVAQTGYTKQAIIGLIKHGRGGNKLAVALATAWGCPHRWHELLDDAVLGKVS